MGGAQERWTEKIKGMYPDNSEMVSGQYDVPCEGFPGIKARFAVIEGKGLEDGIYLVVGVDKTGISCHPEIRDAIFAFAANALVDSDSNQAVLSGHFVEGIRFEIAGSIKDTESTILRLLPWNPKRDKNIVEAVQYGEGRTRMIFPKDRQNLN